jgi:NADH-quinone oxidoreductase subunit A
MNPPEIEISQYGTAALLLALALALTAGLMFLSHLVSTSNPTIEKQMSYECGEDPVGTAWLRFNIRFYVVALVFVLFDVEMALIYPVAAIFKNLTSDPLGDARNWGVAVAVFSEVAFFVGVLFLGLIYIWAKGDLGWVRTFKTATDQGLRSWKLGKSTQTPMIPIAPSDKAKVGGTHGVGL